MHRELLCLSLVIELPRSVMSRPKFLVGQAFLREFGWQGDGVLEQNPSRREIQLPLDRFPTCVSPGQTRYGIVEIGPAAAILFKAELPSGQVASGFASTQDVEVLTGRIVCRPHSARFLNFLGYSLAA